MHFVQWCSNMKIPLFRLFHRRSNKYNPFLECYVKVKLLKKINGILDKIDIKIVSLFSKRLRQQLLLHLW